MRALKHTVIVLMFVFTGLAPLPAHAQADTEPDAGAVAERLLTSIGGRARWAALRATVNDSQQNRAQEPTVVRAVIHMDFRSARFRIETTGPDLHLIRVVDGQSGWRLNREGLIEDLPALTRDEDLRWYAGHVYRTLHRVAAQDPALRLALAKDGRLEVHEGDRRIAWYRLDARGQPYAFGAHEDEKGSLCGPWDFEKDGIRHPVWVSNPDGSWRVRLLALETNPSLPAELFARPETPPAEVRKGR